MLPQHLQSLRQPTPRLAFVHILSENRPQALAWVRGNTAAPTLSGLVKFFDTPYGGVLVESEVFGLPDITAPGPGMFYALHIHESGDCSGNFSGAGGHFNPTVQPHPYHVGDLLPLLSNRGYAWSVFYDRRLTVRDILDRSVIVHANQDDFTTQPSGDPGMMIGCGVIRKA